MLILQHCPFREGPFLSPWLLLIDPTSACAWWDPQQQCRLASALLFLALLSPGCATSPGAPSCVCPTESSFTWIPLLWGNGHKGPSDTAFLSHSGWIALPAQFLRVFACVSVRLWSGAFARGRESH